MRYLELELEGMEILSGVQPPLQGVSSAALLEGGELVVLDRLEGTVPRILVVKFVTGRVAKIRPVAFDPAFAPRIVMEVDEGRGVAIGAGPGFNGILFDAEGRVVRRYDFGAGVADAATDPDGNIVVARSEPPLLDRYGLEGDCEEEDPSLGAIIGHTEQKSGSILMIQRDGALWLNLSEKYDADGALLDTLDPAALFGAGRVCGDRLGWDGIVVLSQDGRLTAMLPRGERRPVRVPSDQVRQVLGRGLTAATDLLMTRGETLYIFDTAGLRLLTFRILSE